MQRGKPPQPLQVHLRAVLPELSLICAEEYRLRALATFARHLKECAVLRQDTRKDSGKTRGKGKKRKELTMTTQPRQYHILQGQGVPDGGLVGQALTGDQSAFELLVSRYHTSLVNYIRSILKDDGQVYDVLQHVFLQLYVS